MIEGRFAGMLRKQGRRLYEQGISLAPRSEEPYATHVPVLVGVAAAYRPKSLLEFGAGTFSTLSFLDDVAFPSLQRVESYENNREWFEQLRQRLPANARVHLQLVEGEMYRAVEGANPSGAGMIFIDDSPTAEARVPTVVEVARRCGTGPVVVLHDNDLRRLRLAARKFENRISFNAFNPQCCVMWHGHPERRPILEQVDRILHRHAARVPLTEIRAWAQIFPSELK
jgi:predicted O-methyltransferase YrrM